MIDEELRVLFDRTLPNRPEAITTSLTPFRDQVRTVMESTVLCTGWWTACRTHRSLSPWRIPIGLHAITRAKIKADNRNARTLARLLPRNMPPPPTSIPATANPRAIPY